MTNLIDISSEEYRVYSYADGSVFRIDGPAELHVIFDDKGITSHRVVGKDGVTHRPTRGWVGISWKPQDDGPAFVA